MTALGKEVAQYQNLSPFVCAIKAALEAAHEALKTAPGANGGDKAAKRQRESAIEGEVPGGGALMRSANEHGGGNGSASEGPAAGCNPVRADCVRAHRRGEASRTPQNVCYASLGPVVPGRQPE